MVYPDTGRTVQELARMASLPVKEAADVVSRLEADGYLRGFADEAGLKRYYLTDIGILRVSSAFT